MIGLIDKIDFSELEAEKYWSFAKSFKGDVKLETRNMIFSGDYMGARKMDGAYYRFIKDLDGNMSLQGRTRGVGGNFLDKIGHVPHLHDYFESLPNGICLLGEIYFPENEGSSNVTKIMGCKEDKAIQRQELGEKLHYYVFDIWAINGESFLKKEAYQRFDTISFMSENFQSEYVDYAKYYEGNELWEQLQTILEEGGEGIVITKKHSCPEPGKRPARKTLKIKKEIANNIDCFFTGMGTEPSHEYNGKEIETWKYWENLKTNEKMQGEFYKEYLEGAPIIPITKPYYNGWAGSLEIGVVKDDKVIPIGFLSGLADELKADPKSLKGKTIEVSCMEIQYHKDGRLPGLRHAKFIQFRPDKDWKECKWQDIFGE